MAITPTFATPWEKFLKWALRTGAWGLPYLSDYFESDHQASPEDLPWRRLIVQITRDTPSGTSEDVAVCTQDFVHAGESTLGDWTPANYLSVETAMDNFWQTFWAPQANEDHTVTQYRWYKMQFNPMTNPKPFVPSGAPDRVTTKAFTGATSTNRFPYQVATSITEKTAVPKHWGRLYVPGLVFSNMDDGRIPNTNVDGICQEYHDSLDIAMTAGFHPVVTVTQIDKVPFRALFGVSAVQVDNIPDVVRRRRPRQVNYRKVLPLGG